MPDRCASRCSTVTSSSISGRSSPSTDRAVRRRGRASRPRSGSPRRARSGPSLPLAIANCVSSVLGIAVRPVGEPVGLRQLDPAGAVDAHDAGEPGPSASASIASSSGRMREREGPAHQGGRRSAVWRGRTYALSAPGSRAREKDFTVTEPKVMMHTWCSRNRRGGTRAYCGSQTGSRTRRPPSTSRQPVRSTAITSCASQSANHNRPSCHRGDSGNTKSVHQHLRLSHGATPFLEPSSPAQTAPRPRTLDHTTATSWMGESRRVPHAAAGGSDRRARRTTGFSGVVRVDRAGGIELAKAYGLADRATGSPTRSTRSSRSRAARRA